MRRHLKNLLFGLAGILFFCATLLYVLYRPVNSGTLYLQNAPGVVTISFEEETGIAHIHGDSLASAVYAQGFQHA
jgi:acyl-homoserine lactone acylase PvdQ